jgi:hypothetical protein
MSNKDEWGNVELPGVSDEKLLTTNWNYASAIKEREQKGWQDSNKERWQDLDWKKTHDEKVKKVMQTELYKTNHAAGVIKRTLDPAWHDANRKARFKPIVTPYGIFNSLDSASIEIHLGKFLSNRKTVISVRTFIRSAIKNASKEFYYITKEKYIMLTGKDIV